MIVPSPTKRTVNVTGTIQRGSGSAPRPSSATWPVIRTLLSGVGVFVGVFVGVSVGVSSNGTNGMDANALTLVGEAALTG